MRYLQLGLAFVGLVHGIQVVDIGHDFQIGHNSFTHRKPGSDFEETFSCAHSGKTLTFNNDRTTAACCTPSQHLSGSHATEFHCCGAGHSVAGSPASGYRCCPDGFSYDGRLCYEPGHGAHGTPPQSEDQGLHDAHNLAAANSHLQQAHFMRAGGGGGGDGRGGDGRGGDGRGGDGQGGNGQGGNGRGGDGRGGDGRGGDGRGGDGRGGDGRGGDGHGGQGGNGTRPGWCHRPCDCQSGVNTGKCYLFKMDDGNYFGYNSRHNTYTSEKDSAEHIMGKFRFCRDSKCTPGCTVEPGEAVAVLDIHGAANGGQGANNWLDGRKDGGHITKTPNWSESGNFTITKWTCGKYCLGGYQYGVGPTCPSLAPAITFNTNDPQACVPLELVEVPCDVRDKKNSCRWQKEPGSCGTGDPKHCKCGYDV